MRTDSPLGMLWLACPTTRLLDAAATGDRQADLLPPVYDDANWRPADGAERPGHTFERDRPGSRRYLRLVGGHEPAGLERSGYFRGGAEAMPHPR